MLSSLKSKKKKSPSIQLWPPAYVKNADIANILQLLVIKHGVLASGMSGLITLTNSLIISKHSTMPCIDCLNNSPALKQINFKWIHEVSILTRSYNGLYNSADC